MTKLTWAKRPVRGTCPLMGLRMTWHTRCRRFRVVTYPDQQTTLKFIATDNRGPLIVGRFRTLRSAQRACEAAA